MSFYVDLAETQDERLSWMQLPPGRHAWFFLCVCIPRTDYTDISGL
jgi:hypothetical protein